jgi:hypothetical protein
MSFVLGCKPQECGQMVGVLLWCGGDGVSTKIFGLSRSEKSARKAVN